MTDQYAVMGNPIDHSLSPMIHAEFAAQTQQDISYIKIKVPIGKIEQAIKDFQKEHGKGINITVPFKQEAFKIVDMCSQAAELARAVNTITFHDDHSLLGDNTDGIGFIKDLTVNHEFTLEGKRIVILGSGGAARGIIHPILMQNPALVVIANRTIAKAQTLINEFNSFGRVAASGLDTLAESYDLIINATSFSLAEDANIPFPSTILSESGFCYDLMYGQKPTPFLKWAIQHGVRQSADGIGMLVEQAAESFYIWRNVRPNTKKVIEMLRKKLT